MEITTKTYLKIFIAGLTVILLISFINLVINSQKTKRQERIVYEENLAYECYKQDNKSCLETHIKSLAELKNQTNDSVLLNIKEQFKEERTNIIKKMAETNKVVITTNRHNPIFFNEKFLELKEKYLKTYFNNDEDELYEELDKFNGYRYYAKKVVPLPDTGILFSTIKNKSKNDNIHILIHSCNLLVHFTNIKTNEKMSIFINENDSISIALPDGEYKMTYTGGITWCGLEDGFKGNYIEGESSQNIIIKNPLVLYFGQKAFGMETLGNASFLIESDYIELLKEEEWNVAIAAIQKERMRILQKQIEEEQKIFEKETNPNYDLKLNNKKAF